MRENLLTQKRRSSSKLLPSEVPNEDARRGGKRGLGRETMGKKKSKVF